MNTPTPEILEACNTLNITPEHLIAWRTTPTAIILINHLGQKFTIIQSAPRPDPGPWPDGHPGLTARTGDRLTARTGNTSEPTVTTPGEKDVTDLPHITSKPRIANNSRGKAPRRPATARKS